jgi:hypothetical protein
MTPFVVKTHNTVCVTTHDTDFVPKNPNYGLFLICIERPCQRRGDHVVHKLAGRYDARGGFGRVIHGPRQYDTLISPCDEYSQSPDLVTIYALTYPTCLSQPGDSPLRLLSATSNADDLTRDFQQPYLAPQALLGVCLLPNLVSRHSIIVQRINSAVSRLQFKITQITMSNLANLFTLAT